MAQAKVTDFFAARKGNRDIHPSKRRKLQNVAEEPREVKPILEGKTIILPTVRESTRSRRRVKQEDLKGPLALPTRATRSQTKTKQNNPTVQITSSRSKPAGQPHIKDVLSVKQEPSSGQSNPDADNACQGKPSRSRTPSPGRAAESETSTAACDDHTASPPGTPTKQSAKSAQTSKAIQPVGRKRGRLDKSTRKDLLTDVTPETSPELATTGYDFSKFLKVKDTTLTKEGSPSVRKKLVMKRRSGESLAEAAKESTVEEDEEAEPAINRREATIQTKSPSEQMPQSKTEKPSTSSENPATKDGKVKVKKDIKTVEKKLSVAEVQAKLAKCGKLAELQERLAAFSTAAAKVKKDKDVQRLSEVSKDQKDKANKAVKAPAYERYHSLAVPVPPTLTLPYRYKVLDDMFQGVETVISMLYKRMELCTFSKLKNAVELIARRAFEERHLGQIHTVYPDAYVLRQETNLPVYGKGKSSAYQLTVEANLGVSKDGLKDKDGRVAFTASKLLERKTVFHRLLVNIVKQHHKVFLSKLERPLTVPDDKVTRWHPRFEVDKVPDIEPALLPQSPNITKFATASEVLHQARGGNNMMNSRVQKALESVMRQKKMEKEKMEKETKQPGSMLPSSKSSSETKSTDSNSNKNASASIKGVSQSLLERIRAKEVQKQMNEMTRSPAEGKRRVMIGRLPEIVRIIRTFFVTFKKPCLSMDEAIQKVTDSYRSSMALDDAEAHIRLLLEIAPTWISTITVRKGTYLKIDRNHDLASVMDTINKSLKDSQ